MTVIMEPKVAKEEVKRLLQQLTKGPEDVLGCAPSKLEFRYGGLNIRTDSLLKYLQGRIKRLKHGKLDEETIKAYCEKGGCWCPFCGSSNLSDDSWDADAGTATQEMRCVDCGERWRDVYTLTGINYDGRKE